MKKHTTRKALFTSIVSLMLCLTMLMGTTFAWFTDTASVKVTRIQSGILKVGLDVMSVTAGEPTGTWVDYSNDSADPAAQKAIWTADDLWEPGYTSYKFVKITNEGNLALEFAIDLISKDSVANAVTGEHLHEALEVYYTVIDEVASVDRETYKGWTSAGKLSDLLTPDTDGVIHGVILPNENKDANITVAIAIHMMEEAGNEFQTLKEEFDLNLWAKQYTEEKDSFDNQYDADAKYGSEDTDGNFTEREDPSVPDAPVEPQPPVVTVDKTALGTEIDNAITVQGNYDDTIWNAYTSALNAAKSVYADEAADQEAVNKAVIDLQAAKAALKVAQATVTVEHYTYGRNETVANAQLLEDKTVTESWDVGSVYTASEISIDGYHFDSAVPTEKQITVSKDGENIIKLYYKQNDAQTATVTVTYKFNDREAIIKTGTVTEDAAYTVTELTTDDFANIGWYKLTSSLPTVNYGGDYNVEVTYERKTAEVTVKYVDSTNDSIVLATVTATASVGSEYAVESKTFDYYKAVGTVPATVTVAEEGTTLTIKYAPAEEASLTSFEISYNVPALSNVVTLSVNGAEGTVLTASEGKAALNFAAVTYGKENLGTNTLTVKATSNDANIDLATKEITVDVTVTYDAENNKFVATVADAEYKSGYTKTLETADNTQGWPGGPLSNVENLIQGDEGYSLIDPTNPNQYLKFTVTANPNGDASGGLLRVEPNNWSGNPKFEIIKGDESITEGKYTIVISVAEFDRLLTDGGLVRVDTMIHNGSGIAKFVSLDLIEIISNPS